MHSRRSFLCGPVAAALPVLAGAAASPQRDQYGGWRKLKGRTTGFFHAERVQGRWWLVTPEGNVFFSKGVCTVRPARGGAEPVAEWAKTASRQLLEWNFNTIGAWSDPSLYAPTAGIPYTPIVGPGGAARREAGRSGGVPDYFSEGFRQVADSAAQRLCAPRANDPWLLGYFTDNELAWTHNRLSWSPNAPWNLEDDLLDLYLKMPESSAGRQKADEFLRTRGMIKGAVTEDDRDGFAELVAAEYGRVCRDAIRRYDPNHMILGCRFAGHAPEPILRGIGAYSDVISFNNYHSRPPLWKLRQMTEITGKPTMITEFSFKAMDSGLPNTKGAAEPVATQQDRAEGFTRYVQDLASLPSCVGFHWFEFRDQPKEGRGGDGENSNYGVVKMDGEPWDVLTARMKEINETLEALATR